MILLCENYDNKMDKLLKIAEKNGYYWDCSDPENEYFYNDDKQKEIVVPRWFIIEEPIENIVW